MFNIMLGGKTTKVDTDAIKTEVKNRKEKESGLEGGRADEGNCT